MRMMRLFVALIFACVCASSARAESVTAVQAAKAAVAWMVREGNADVAQAGTSFITTTNNAKYYAVKMLGGGTVITTGDTALEPVVLFTSATVDLTNLDHRAPLWHLLNHDAAARLAADVVVSANAPMATRSLASKASLAAAISTETRSAHAEKWAALISEGSSATPRTATLAVSKTLGSETWIYEPYTVKKGLADVRVNTLCGTRWSQDVAQDLATYNYYTPNGSDPSKFKEGDADNMVCGCVATAMSQVMRYFRWPQASVTPVTRECSWEDTPMNLTMKGGVYNWDNMPLVPESGTLTDEQRQEIGKLTSDAGISVYMGYNTEGSGESGAFSFDVGTAFKDVFGYASATFFYDIAGMIASEVDPSEFTAVRSNALQRAIFANLDAGLPMVMGLSGHEVVADGYGYSTDGLDYVHINMGWAGYCDYWYCMPVVKYNSSTYGGYMTFNDLTYNIFTNATGSAVISGRVFDDDDQPAEGATVKFYKSGTTLSATATTSSKGVFGAVVPAGTYTLVADYGGATEELTGVTVACPTTRDVFFNGLRHVQTVYTDDPTDLGNNWGNEIRIGDPCVSNLTKNAAYMNLNKALAAADASDVLMLFGPAPLKSDVTISKSLTIFSRDLASAQVGRIGDAALTVASGATLTLSNIVFSTGAVPPVHANMGGKVALAGKIGMDVLTTSDADGLVLLDAIAPVGGTLTLDCAACSGEDAVFGTATCDLETAQHSVSNILNKYDIDLYGAAKDVSGTVTLYWKDRPVDPATALAYATGPYHDEGEKTTYYNSYTRLFRDYTNGAEIVVLRDATIGAYASNIVVKIVKPTVIRAASGTKKILPNRGCSFSILEGASLGITNITFDGAMQMATNIVSGMGLHKIGGIWSYGAYTVTNVYELGWSADGNGQFLSVEGGALTIGSGTTVQNFTTQRKGKQSLWSTSPYGPILLKDGTLTVDGATIASCNATGNGTYGVFGGGLAAEKGRLNLIGATIKDCSAFKNGGAVFVAGGVSVRIEGKTVVNGNTSGAGSDDIYLATTNVLPVVGTLTSGAKIGFRFASGSEGDACGNYEGGQFAVADGTLSAEDIPTMLINDVVTDCKATIDEEDATRLVWSVASKSPTGKKDADGTAVKAIVTMRDGSETTYWTTLKNALNALEGDADILIKTTQTLGGDDDVVISHNIGIYATNTLGAVKFARSSDISFVIASGASLSLSNVVAASEEMQDDGGNVTPYTTPLFYVNGGALTCDCVRITGYLAGPVTGVNTAPRRAGAVCVWNGGDFTMRETVISDVHNTYVDTIKNIESASGSGVLVEGYSTAHLESGMITNCWAQFGGALCVGNSSEVWVGDVALYGNYLKDGDTPSNVRRYQTGTIHLTQPVVQKFGCSIGTSMKLSNWPVLTDDTNYIARLSKDWTTDQLKTAATCFRRDPDGCVGKAVTNATEAFVVWRTALTEDDLYVDGRGVTNALVGWGEPKPKETPIPAARTGLVYNGYEQVGVETDDGYGEGLWEFDTASDYKMKHPGFYYAVVKLSNTDYNWSDGSSDPKRILWSMDKKDLTITVLDGIPDWNLAEHGSNEAPGKNGTVTNYFDAYFSMSGLCEPPDKAEDVIDYKYRGYYSPGGLLLTTTVYSVYFDYRLLNDTDYYVTKQNPGIMHVVSNAVAVSAATIRELISNPQLVIRTAGIGASTSVGSSGSGEESLIVGDDDCAAVLVIENVPAGTYELMGSDTPSDFKAEATQTLTEKGTLRLKAPKTTSSAHFWKIRYTP